MKKIDWIEEINFGLKHSLLKQSTNLRLSIANEAGVFLPGITSTSTWNSWLMRPRFMLNKRHLDKKFKP